MRGPPKWLGKLHPPEVSRYGSVSLKTCHFRRIIWMGNRLARIETRAGRMVRSASVSVALLLCAGCAGPVKSLYPPAVGERARSIYVINHGGLHTGLALKRTDIPPGLWPANRDYANSKYLEVGWGDDDGYRKPLTVGIAVKALAGSRRTVLLADGFGTVREKVNAPRFTVIQVDLSDRGLARLCAHIEKTYALDEGGARFVSEKAGIGLAAPIRRSTPATPGLPRDCARQVVRSRPPIV